MPAPASGLGSKIARPCFRCRLDRSACDCELRRVMSDPDAHDPSARVLRHEGYCCLVVDAGPQSTREKLALLQKQIDRVREDEERFRDEHC